jgi:mono/diheme cytochrome c family protein
MKKIYLCALLLTVLAACQPKKLKQNVIFRPDALETQKHLIDISRDTLLVLKGGSRLNIKKGCISTPQGNLVGIEVKEALTLPEMAKAGLHTRIGTQAASSAGVLSFKFSTTNAKLVCPLEAQIPTDRIEPNAKVYSAEAKAGENIEWTNPQPLTNTGQNEAQNSQLRGKKLYNQLCQNCHFIADKDDFAPTGEGKPQPNYYKQSNQRPRAILIQTPVLDSLEQVNKVRVRLAHMYKYRTEEWLKNFTQNSQKMIAEGDEAAICVSTLYGNKMPNFEQLSEKEIADIYNYIEAESERQKLEIPKYNPERCKEECSEWSQKMADLQTQADNLSKIADLADKDAKLAQSQADTAVANIKQMMTNVVEMMTDTFERGSKPGIFLDILNEIIPQTRLVSSYYTFEIKLENWCYSAVYSGSEDNSLGWKNSRPAVTVVGDYQKRVEVFLVVPQKKIMLHGGLAEQPNVFYFVLKEFLLPHDETAWVYALGEEKGAFYWAAQRFVISASNSITLTPRLSSAQEIEQNIKGISQEINLNVQSSGRREAQQAVQKAEKLQLEADKLATQLRELVAEINQLTNFKPEVCQCRCVTYANAKGEVNAKDTTNVIK